MRSNDERYRNIMKKVEAASATKKKKSKSFYWALGGCAAAAAVVVAVAVPMSLNGGMTPGTAATADIMAEAETESAYEAPAMLAESAEKSDAVDAMEVHDIEDAIAEGINETADTGFDIYTDYGEIYDAIDGKLADAGYMLDDGMAVEEAAAEDVMVEEAPAAAEPAEADMAAGESSKAEARPTGPEGDSPEFSETNVQVEGVDEADIVKTDGRYIYYLCEDRLYIAKAAGQDTEVVGRLKLGGNNGVGYMQEMYLMDGKIIAIGNGYEEYDLKGELFSDEKTYQFVIDVSNPESPRIEKTLGQSGSYVSSRAVDGHVFTVTTKYIWNIYEDEIRTFIPAYGEEDAMKYIAPDSICIARDPSDTAYTVVTSIDVNKAEMSDKSKAIFGGTGNIYCDGETLIAAAYGYESRDEETYRNGKECTIQSGRPVTRVAVYDIRGGEVDLMGMATVKGQLLNQFSMDIYKGYYRFVTHESENTTYIFTEGIDTYEYDNYESNSLYILGPDLKEVGSITDIAEDEYVKSVRFDGDKVYFVTFVQTDPLFCADLSDPANPKITSEVKLPGFSSYLHVFGKDRLLGLGFDTEGEEGFVTTEEIKLSMFDSSDPNNLREITTALVYDCYYSEATYNHKSLLIDTDKGIIGFPGENDYYIYTYDDSTGFVRELRVRDREEDYGWNKRGVMIDDCIYVVDSYGIRVIDMKDMKHISNIVW